MSYKEEIGLVGLIAAMCLGIIYGYVLEIVVPCIVALIAYIGGNHNGEKRNEHLEPPLIDH